MFSSGGWSVGLWKATVKGVLFKQTQELSSQCRLDKLKLWASAELEGASYYIGQHFNHRMNFGIAVVCGWCHRTKQVQWSLPVSLESFVALNTGLILWSMQRRLVWSSWTGGCELRTRIFQAMVSSGCKPKLPGIVLNQWCSIITKLRSTRVFVCHRLIQ